MIAIVCQSSLKSNKRGVPKTWRYLAGSYYNMPHANKFGYPDAFFRLYELNFRSMRVINFENLHILVQNHSFTIPIDNGK